MKVQDQANPGSTKKLIDAFLQVEGEVLPEADQYKSSCAYVVYSLSSNSSCILYYKIMHMPYCTLCTAPLLVDNDQCLQAESGCIGFLGM